MSMISKKDLLALTGISYGQLYRWKRQKLIPEEWFVKKSSYTGQETFFPREQVMSRVQAILDLKDNYSLEEMAAILSPGKVETRIGAAELAGMEGVDADVLDSLKRKDYSLSEAAFLLAVCRAASGRGAALLAENGLGGAERASKADVIFIEMEKGMHAVFVPTATEVVFDSGVNVLARFTLGELAGELALKLNNKKEREK